MTDDKKIIKVLYIAYQFPPNGGGGVQRALRHANAMASAGYLVEVLTIDRSIIDEQSLINKINHNIKITKIQDVLANNKTLFRNKIVNKIIAFLSSPDKNILWALSAYLKVKDYRYDIIFSTSHPYSSHVLALLLKIKNPKAQLLIDYRDAWSNNPSLKFTKKYPLFYFLSGPLEGYINSRADKIITVSMKLIKYIRNHNGKVDVIYNAFDEDDFKNLESSKKADKFVIFYMGSLYAERNLNHFFDAFNLFLEGLNINQRKKIYFRIVGINDINKINSEIRKNIKYYESINIEVENYLPHQQIIKEGLSANLLLLLIGNIVGSESVVTGKLLEYIKFEAPILAIVPQDGEAASIIAKTKTGEIFGETEIEIIANYMKKIFDNWIADYTQQEFILGRQDNAIYQYSKYIQNGKLIDLISR